MSRRSSRALALACAALTTLSLFAVAAAADDEAQAKVAPQKEAKPAHPTAVADPVAVAAALRRADRTEVKTAAGEPTGSAGTALDVRAAAAGGVQETAGGLSTVHGTTERQGTVVAGSARDVRMKATRVAAAAPRPQASPRQLRRMNADRVAASLAQAFQACADASTAPRRAPGSALIVASVGPSGQVESTEVASSSGATPDVLACVAQRVREVRFGAPGGAGALVAIPAAFAVSHAR